MHVPADVDAPRIAAVDAVEILDGRLEPTLRVTVRTDDGAVGRADVPSGRSTGRREATERRDGGDRYGGLGVRGAVEAVRGEVAEALRGTPVTAQRRIDRRLVELDGTDDRSRLGGNATTGVSLATLRAAAASLELPAYRYIGSVTGARLPVPFFDVIEGGELAESGLGFQEHQLVPTGMDEFSAALRACAESYHELAGIVADRWGRAALNVGVEGGYTPQATDPREAFDAALEATEEAGYGGEFGVAIDAAASHLYDPDAGTYDLLEEPMDGEELFAFYEELAATYPLVSIEDPFHEEAFGPTAELTAAIGADVQIVGDDLFVTNADRLARGIDRGAANALLLKVNQVGTVTEALDAAELARRNGYAVQVSERSGQTPDTWLAELAAGIGAGQVKTGVSRGERTEQYNRLLEIEAELGPAARYAGWS